MKKLRVYLDNCCFNRPYDDQSMVSIKIETEAKIALQNKIRHKDIELCWSYILDFENRNNPFPERKKEIENGNKSPLMIQKRVSPFFLI